MGLFVVPLVLVQIPYMFIEKFANEVLYPPIEFMRNVKDEISFFLYDTFYDR